jgi:GNAT superfamily N-acetyltransferase
MSPKPAAPGLSRRKPAPLDRDRLAGCAAGMPAPVIEIRSATAADVPLILDFIRGLATYEKLLDEVEATAERLTATLFPADGRAAAECVLAEADGIPAGFAVFFTNYSTFLAKPGLYLEDLFVNPEQRGRGLGRALLLHLAGLANQRGCGRMEWSVLDWNQPAIDFYESLGARRMREWQICRLTGAALAQYA